VLAEAVANPRAYLEYWLLAGERILGNCRIRPAPSPPIELDGGHVSYDVRPSERGRGYGKELSLADLFLRS